MGIIENLEVLGKQLNPAVRLVAVSKTVPVDEMLITYNAGVKIFGENKVQEITSKQPLLPNDIEWHFIGHLQTNKVKYIVPFINMIHSIDSLKLLTEVNRQASKVNRVIDCLFQFHIAAEETKFGLDFNEACSILISGDYREMKNVRICGVMGMATFTTDLEVCRKEFRNLKVIFDRLKSEYFQTEPCFKEISMGMTGDYSVAIEEGSTLVRIGTALFGNRNY